MSANVNEQVVMAARSRIGKPFRHHYRPIDACQHGTETIPACFEDGLDSRGYDCSGLVIASLCEVLDISILDWPPELRHNRQMRELAEDVAADPGDVLVYDPEKEAQVQFSEHMGLLATRNSIIHASGVTRLVEESPNPDDLICLRTIPLGKLMEAVTTF